MKVLGKNRTSRNGFTWRLGLNGCAEPWNTGHCTDGGLYACEWKDLLPWIGELYTFDVDECAIVTVPDGARSAVFEHKVKAERLIVVEFI